MTATYPASLNGHEPSRLRAALEAAGGSLKSLTVLAPQNDPFRVDTTPVTATVHGLPIPSISSASPGSGIFADCTTS